MSAHDQFPVPTNCFAILQCMAYQRTKEYVRFLKKNALAFSEVEIPARYFRVGIPNAYKVT